MTDASSWTELVPGGIEDLLRPLAAWTTKELTAMVPSFSLGQDGPSLTSVFCFFDDLLCEVSLRAQGETSYDFVRLDNLRNLRVETREIKVGEGEDTKTYQLASVTLLHFARFTSVLSYVGDSSADWLELVRGLLGPRGIAVLSGK